ncbi:hypothetical protein IF2G_07029 [Cordyceps javanica]|nr:hypothetical protein IF2G_07029 [Cordyceps javanica]
MRDGFSSQLNPDVAHVSPGLSARLLHRIRLLRSPRAGARGPLPYQTVAGCVLQKGADFRPGLPAWDHCTADMNGGTTSYGGVVLRMSAREYCSMMRKRLKGIALLGKDGVRHFVSS